MLRFFKKPKLIPTFNVLNATEYKDKYFVRTATWRVIDHSNIAVTDPKGPRILTLDPWPQLVFLAGDGQRTVKEYVQYAASKYEATIPGNLDQTIVHEIETLLRYGIISLNDTKGRPAPEFDRPLT